MVKAQTLPEVLTAENLEAASVAILEDSDAFNQIIHNPNCRIRIIVHIRHHNKYIKTFRSKIQIPIFSRKLLDFNFRIETFKKQILKIKTLGFRIQIFNRNHRLKYLLHILITCLIQNKVKLPVIITYLNHLATNCIVRPKSSALWSTKSV